MTQNPEIRNVEQLGNGDAVLMTDLTGTKTSKGRTMALHVLILTDSQHGFPVRHRYVNVGYGVGRWNVTVTNEDIAEGRVRLERG